MSDLEVESEEDITSDDSFDENRKKTPKKRGPKPKNKAFISQNKPKPKKQKPKKEGRSGNKRSLNSIKKEKLDLSSTAKRLKRDIVYIEAKYSSDEGKNKSLSCKECDEEFESKVDLREHRKVHGV